MLIPCECVHESGIQSWIQSEIRKKGEYRRGVNLECEPRKFQLSHPSNSPQTLQCHYQYSITFPIFHFCPCTRLGTFRHAVILRITWSKFSGISWTECTHITHFFLFEAKTKTGERYDQSTGLIHHQQREDGNTLEGIKNAVRDFHTQHIQNNKKQRWSFQVFHERSAHSSHIFLDKREKGERER